MAFPERPTIDHGLDKQRAKAEADKTPEAGKFTLRDAHGHGILAESSYDLTDHAMEPQTNEGKLGSQGEPQPSGGQPGMRPQLGSFEAGQTDTGGGAPGEDVERGEHPFIGLDPELPKKMRKPQK